MEDTLNAYYVRSGGEADIVFARSRGHARRLFNFARNREYTDRVSIRILAKDINRSEEGFALPTDPLWEMVYYRMRL